MQVVRDWFIRYFSDPQAILLIVLLALGFGVVLLMGGMIAPVLVALVLAYLLEGVVQKLLHPGSNRNRVVTLVYLIFITVLFSIIFGLTPLLWGQLEELVQDLPTYIAKGQALLQSLPEHYTYVTHEQIDAVMKGIQGDLKGVGQRILTISLASIPGIITLLIYLILGPVLIFFFMRDKERLVHWFTGFLPTNHQLSSTVWTEVDQQIGNYIRGKFWEIFIVGITTYIAFAILGLKYAILLAVLVGLSVLVPYIGAAVVTIPIALIAYFQWGWGEQFGWLMLVYGVIQALDGNVLVPLLFSEVVNLHPVAIIVAVLVFGGLWGFWGVFFAIPLATLVNAILIAWPRPGVSG